MKPRPPVILAVLDGWGVAPAGFGNAITTAQTPHYDIFVDRYPATTLDASGVAVGLLTNEAGNSEAGHMNLGAGRTVRQQVRVVSDAIADGSFFKNPAFRAVIDHAKKRNGRVHLMGLLSSEQSPHSHPDHLAAFRKLLALNDVPQVFLHLFTDGRDSSPSAAETFLSRIVSDLSDRESVATLIGRSFAMDRKKDWSHTAVAYQALVDGSGEHAATASSAVLAAYRRGETDEFISPTVISADGRIKSGDGVIFFNFRADRARQLVKAFVQPDFEQKNSPAFLRTYVPDLAFATLTDDGPDLPGVYAGYPEVVVADSLPFALASLNQFYIGESEKFAHVTYFFNGGHSGPVANETCVRIPSPEVLHYNRAPDMAAAAVTEAVIAAVRKNGAEFVCVNFANADMLGHTGDIDAAIRGIERIDACLGQLATLVAGSGGTLFVTADHGNAEIMRTPDGAVYTEHTTSRVPFILVNEAYRRSHLRPGTLCDVAPTILSVMGIAQPVAMTGQSLLVS